MGYKSREQQQEYQRIWRSRRRAEYFKDKSCVQCGSTEKLELDHIDPKTKKYSPAALWSMSDSNPNKIAELKKCQVLCYDCHGEKTRRDLSEMHSQDYCSYGHDMSLTRIRHKGGTRCGYCNYLRRGLQGSLEEWLARRKTV